METLLVVGLLLVLLAAMSPSLYALQKRLATMPQDLELWRALHRRGLSANDAAQDPQALGFALHRCRLCTKVEKCAEWLASGERTDLEKFCPNARYLERLECS